ncbi:hypothetical protein CLIB1423_06S04236 [[Candida] railenensis]|uniref:Uncharacterized protein n=1 Tax=[Candida] railenensis TaxID=45579 RepID=A0A9P0VXC5_9ASCO|nr:hypothetical protein CLIB1423_06S04236 [[Candida] railenensis]
MFDTGAANALKAWIALIVELESQCSDLRFKLADSNARLSAASVEVESLNSRYLHFKQRVEDLEKAQQILIKRETIPLSEREVNLNSIGVLQMELEAIHSDSDCFGQGSKNNEDIQLLLNPQTLSYGIAVVCDSNTNLVNNREPATGPHLYCTSRTAKSDNKFATTPK